MAEKKKRNQSEAQLRNLEKGNFANKSPSERREIARRGAQRTNEIKREKVKRAEANEYIWQMLGEKTVQEVMEGGTLAQKIDLLKAVLPKDAQNQILSGSLDIQKIFITQKEKEETDKHIEEFIKESEKDEG